MTDNAYHITPAEARELFRLDPTTGQVFFQQRSRRWFESDQSWKTWNARFAEKETFLFFDKSKGEFTGAILGHTVRRSVVVWCLWHGEWPARRIAFKDGDKTNTCPENLGYKISRREQQVMKRRKK